MSYTMIIVLPIVGFMLVVVALFIKGVAINGRDHARRLPGDAQEAFAAFRDRGADEWDPREGIFSRGSVRMAGATGPADVTGFITRPRVAGSPVEPGLRPSYRGRTATTDGDEDGEAQTAVRRRRFVF